MTKQELDTLYELLTKLRTQRLEEVKQEHGLTDEDIEEMSDEDLYDLDDYDRLIEGLDIVICTVEEM